MRLFQVDAFADGVFAGNPAAVCLLAGPAEARWMQSVASEMNLSETAFVEPQAAGYGLRWFTPVAEVGLCGHATLASAHVLYEVGLAEPAGRVEFDSVSGPLTDSKLTRSAGAARPVSYRTCALARVACPHRPTSATGVNQRSPYPAGRGSRKAVSDRFISLATDCIHRASAGPPSRHTAAGLPAKAVWVNASTWNNRMQAAYGDHHGQNEAGAQPVGTIPAW